MDTTQLLLTVVLTVSTILLIVVGIQLIFVLRDLRITIRKINGIITAFEKVGGSVEHGFSEFWGFFTGIKSLFKAIDIIHTNKKNGKSRQ